MSLQDREKFSDIVIQARNFPLRQKVFKIK